MWNKNDLFVAILIFLLSAGLCFGQQQNKQYITITGLSISAVVGIDIEVSTNGEDADSPSGPTVPMVTSIASQNTEPTPVYTLTT